MQIIIVLQWIKICNSYSKFYSFEHSLTKCITLNKCTQYPTGVLEMYNICSRPVESDNCIHTGRIS